MKQELFEWVKSIVFAAVFVFVLQLFIVPTTIYHTSMVPTLQPKDMVVIQKTKNIELGDIIVFKSDMSFGEAGVNELPFYRRIFVNENTKKKLIKRVIAGPGDKIEIDGENVYVNDELLNETYINDSGYNTIYIEEIPEDYYFVMGDNRRWSLDSRDPEIGLIEKERIVGKTTLRIFPFTRFGTIDEL